MMPFLFSLALSLHTTLGAEPYAKPIFSFDKTINAKAIELRVQPLKRGPFDCKFRIELSIKVEGENADHFKAVAGSFREVRKDNQVYSDVVAIDRFVEKGKVGTFTTASLSEFSCAPSDPPRKVAKQKPVEYEIKSGAGVGGAPR